MHVAAFFFVCNTSFVLGTSLLIPAAAASELTWTVTNRFPILSDESFEEINQNWSGLSSKSMRALIVDRMQRKARGDDPKVYLLSDPEKVRSRALSHLDSGENVSVSLNMRGGTRCTWVAEPQPIVRPVEGDCVTTMVVARGVPTAVNVRDTSGREEKAIVQVKEIVLVAMGDSYSSGEGNPDRPAIYAKGQQTPNTNDWFLNSRAPAERPVWLDPVCHRSMLSWPVLASLRIALENTDSIVKLVNVTCSGAEFIHGVFLAQRKTVEKIYDSALRVERDGVGRSDRYAAKPDELFLPRSQVNAVRDSLCSPSVDSEDVTLGRSKNVASWRRCPALKLQPDALMLTLGGNDVQFPEAVMGVLIPDKGNNFLGQFGMDVIRSVAGAITPAQLTKNSEAMTAYYAEYLGTAVRGAMVGPEQVVLLKYPNPIGPTGVKCHAANERIKATFMTFAPAVKTRLRGANWAVNLGREEVTEFTVRSYPALMEMLDSVPNSYTRVAWLDSVTAVDGTTLFDGRLLCTEEKDADQRVKQATLEPVYFCRGQECSPFKVQPLSGWNFELPGRRIINTTNDSVLALRTWKKDPTDVALKSAMSGAFHPVTEAHAVAADSAYKGLCKVLKKRNVQCTALQ